MRLDFVSTARRPGAGAILVLLIGVLSVVATAANYQQLRRRADGLDLKIAATTGAGGNANAPAATSDKLLAETRAAIAELATPWGRLLADLEAAVADSQDSVALLAIEPDRETLKVKIKAESRSLPAAVAFAQRLQQSDVLLYPLLDSHEIQVHDQYRPVRFEITAAWRRGT
jgi:hypothetical protein